MAKLSRRKLLVLDINGLLVDSRHKSEKLLVGKNVDARVGNSFCTLSLFDFGTIFLSCFARDCIVQLQFLK